MHRHLGNSVVLAGAVAAVGTALAAADDTRQPPAEVAPAEVEEVVAIAAPLNADAAANAQSAIVDSIASGLDLGDFMRRELGSVFVNEAQGNPLQPDVQYRGFVGSPLLGLPQGIAVYQDAMRVNEPFGDTVNWALIPKSAIDRVLLLPGGNPLFGLNALGGAVAVRTKDGFGHPGAEATLSGGDFGRRSLTGEVGGAFGAGGGYFATATALTEDGWRDYSPTDAKQAFAKLSWRRGTTSFDASITGARTDLVGNGAAPEALLAARRSAIFTRPDRTRNNLAALNVRGEGEFGRLTLRGATYWRRSDIVTYNGDDSDFEACPHDAALLCLEEEDEENGEVETSPALDAGGRPIPALAALVGATVNRTRTEQDGTGFSAQAERQATLGRAGHRLAVGIAYHRASSVFRATTELGRLDATRQAIAGGVFLGDAFTHVGADTSSAAIYVADSLHVGERLRLTAALRYGRATVALGDRLGTALDGSHRFRRVNPALGASVQLTPRFAVYAAYGEANRAPSPVELTCADPEAPCRLPNAFVADPPLKQVVARTAEAGLRGRDGPVAWRLGAFDVHSEDDILFISAGALTNQGYFDNVGRTRRRGLELSLTSDAADARLRWFLHYTWLRATFEDAFAVPAAHHPRATEGELAVAAGKRLPLVPARLLKAGAAVRLHPRLTAKATLLAASAQRLRGDEANLAPPLAGYKVLNLRLDFRLAHRVSAFAEVDNALGERHATFGVFGDAQDVLGETFAGRRFATPAAPRGVWVGMVVRR